MTRRAQPSPWWLATGLIGVVAGVLMVASGVTSGGVGEMPAYTGSTELLFARVP